MTRERGAAVPEFVLALALVLPIAIGIVQLALVAHVRSTLTAAATEGARAGAPLGASVADAEQSARRLADTTLAARFAEDIAATRTTLDGLPVVEVTMHAEVPPLGVAGPGVPVTVTGHAVIQGEP
ncbi:pilus assembly protein [Aeromicrobium sp. YIM 150415]|uniref:TadE/TadG family type IV pilus assembly protein n=1 Tax=Aeromicrobium sp. YIM 150415 TaxID=2803912 RepID=UPI001966351E|nr:TadE family protein [Aeromicrobium sp. YIM 150415]MBM9461810.1 pilus assembly protein [Aeromicrobium sp. YIM 150415]MBM9463158.1 pilus assembly protein [Aeromicrobium sp. YIM 150415]